MICDVCKEKTANVYLTQIVEGQMQKVNLCNSCSKEKGVSDPTGFALADLLSGIGTEKKLERSGDEKTCEACGFSQTDFKKTGRLGCSHCYAIFGEGLDTLLKAMHKGTRHIGKAPKRFSASRPCAATSIESASFPGPATRIPHACTPWSSSLTENL